MVNKYIKTVLGAMIVIGFLAFLALAPSILTGKSYAQSTEYLCTGGNYSNTVDGCKAQTGKPPVSDARIKQVCDVPSSTAAQRQKCIQSGGTTAPDGAAAAPTDTPATKKDDCSDKPLSSSNCGIIKYLVIIINALSAMVGVVVVIMIIIGGIQYSTSADDPQAVANAKKRIMNAVLALVIFIFSYAFLQWVIPGGLF